MAGMGFSLVFMERDTREEGGRGRQFAGMALTPRPPLPCAREGESRRHRACDESASGRGGADAPMADAWCFEGLGRGEHESVSEVSRLELVER